MEGTELSKLLVETAISTCVISEGVDFPQLLSELGLFVAEMVFKNILASKLLDALIQPCLSFHINYSLSPGAELQDIGKTVILWAYRIQIETFRASS